MNINLGNFELLVEPSGKLARLSMGQLDPFLHETRYRMEIESARHFEPRGWDECFPTIESFEGSPTMGDLIAMSPQSNATAHRFQQEWKTVRYTAIRTFQATSPNELEMCFSVHNHSAQDLRFLWASHTLFATQNLRRVVFPDQSTLDDFTLNGTATKSFKTSHGIVRLCRQDCEIQLQTDQPWWGVWDNRGGWPANQSAGFGCLGVEATNCEADVPKDAVILPKERFDGKIILKVLTKCQYF